MEVQIAVAKIPKFGLSDSGDTIEIVERPRGGLTAILADGQTHGRPAKRVSHLVVAKAAHLIADGVRDGAVARGVHDYLFALRDGKVSTELTMVSVDFRSHSLVVTRNTHVPVYLRRADGSAERLDQYVEPIGFHEVMKPLITEIPLVPGLVVLAFTDGVLSAGARQGERLDPDALVDLVCGTEPAAVGTLVDRLLEWALALDRQRPADDMSILAVGVGPGVGENLVRRMAVTMPF